MISVSHKFVFVHPPKCGGTSLANIFAPFSAVEVIGDTRTKANWRPYTIVKKLSNLVDFQNYRVAPELQGSVHDPHAKYASIAKNWKSEWGDISNYHKIGCIRNPFARAVSFFFDPNFGPKNHPLLILDSRKLFKQWIKQELTPFWDYFTLNEAHESKKWEMDYYIRLENIEADCKKVMKKLGLPDRDIPHANKSRTYDGWKQFYDDELIDFIGNLFKEDIEQFGYSI